MSIKESEALLSEVIDLEGILVTLQLISSICENNERRSPAFWGQLKSALDELIEKARRF